VPFALRPAPAAAWSVSPRAGFTWIRSTPSSDWLLRGGAGDFRAGAPTRSFAGLLAGAGPASPVVQVVCVGADVPRATWTEFLSDPLAIPSRCAGGDQAAGRPGATGFARSYAPPLVRHASLEANWLYKPTQTTLEAAVSVSRGRGLPLATDLNFAGVRYFDLAAEGGRPVYVPAELIDPASGQVGPGHSRLDDRLAVVREVGSRGRSAAEQLSFGAARLMGGGLVEVYYTFSRSKDLATGLAGPGGGAPTTSADPRIAEWAAADFEQRHAFQLLLQRKLRTWATLAVLGRVVSGTPYTPLVASDVNGDGLANDRAFVFDPRGDTGMRELLERAPSATRACLLRQAGRVADRNGCRTPWSPYLDAQLNLTPRVGRKPRGTLSLSAQNVTAALDQLIHGGEKLRGWGQEAVPDPVLLRVIGFDPDARAFRYQVNPGFGVTPARSPRVPFSLRIQARFTLGADPATQALASSVATMQASMSPAEIQAAILKRWRNVPALVLEHERVRGVGLTPDQAAQLRSAADSIASRIAPLAASLAGLATADSTRTPGSPEPLEQAQTLLTGGFDVVRSVLTREQWNRLPRSLRMPPRATVPLLPSGGISLLPDL
jgi:hypothetical protein